MNDIIANPKKTADILNQYQYSLKKKYGQNFLIDANIIEKIADIAIPNKDVCVIEIGPGIGALTQFLSKKSNKVIAFEIDQSLKTILESNFENSNVTFHFQDFLKIDLPSYCLGNNEYVVAANLPYYITTPILFKLFEYDWITQICVMMQKEVALRFQAIPNQKEYNALSVIAQHLYEIQLEFIVSKNVFIPKPKVDSAIITFKRKKQNNTIDSKLFFCFVHQCFEQRRKTLINNLKKHYDSKKIEDILNDWNLPLTIRPQELSLTQFRKLFEELKNV